MDLLKFEDTCIVSRVTEIDAHDTEYTTDVYSGACAYQQGVQTYQGISQRNSVVFIPGFVRIKENDTVRVVAVCGVAKEGKVNTVRNVQLPLSNNAFTRIELKYDTDVTED
jgi:hypothetical protein